ncbi:MAG: response regulator transcription factor [Rhodospirillales bacterium]|jgi:two-component system cell cycle response regulator CtrA|nr:response regulator transcription factor [Rhodospirillales bacterium]
MLLLQVGTKPLRRAEDLLELRRRGLNREHAGTGAEALEFLRLYRFDAVLLDLDLRDMPALDLIRRVRGSGSQTPILAVTGQTDPLIRVKALDLGADDVLSAFCPIDELLARLRAVIRRSGGHTKSVLNAGPLELCLDSHEVKVSGKPLHLTPKEYALLELLMLKRGVSLTKGACLNHLYGAEEEPELKTVDVIVCRLRKKLAAVGLPSLVQNVWGCGYRLAEVAPTTTPAARQLATDLALA